MGSYSLPPGLSAEGVSIPGLSQDSLEERLLEARKTYKLNMGCVPQHVSLQLTPAVTALRRAGVSSTRAVQVAVGVCDQQCSSARLLRLALFAWL